MKLLFRIVKNNMIYRFRLIVLFLTFIISQVLIIFFIVFIINLLIFIFIIRYFLNNLCDLVCK